MLKNKDKYLLTLKHSHRVPVISLPCRVKLFDKVIFFRTYRSAILIAIILFHFCLFSTLTAQDNYIQQRVDYDMDLKYDHDQKMLSGKLEVIYHHFGSSPLDTLCFHLWMNAFKDNSTPFAEDQLLVRNRDFYFAKDEERGFYKSIKAYDGEEQLSIRYIDNAQEMAYIILDDPLKPGSSQLITMEFELKIPKAFSRTGYTDEAVYLAYFYPKIAVYDDKGWHRFPYLNLGEYYSNFGDYEVTIDLPTGFNIASGGKLEQQTDSTFYLKSENVIDVMLVLSESYSLQNKKSIRSPFGNEQSIQFFGPQSSIQSASVDYAKEVLEYMQSAVGELPYDQLTVVPASSGGGMEYPGIFTVSGNKKRLEYYTAHEMIHQWFYSRIATNERAEPWLDEGVTHYYTSRYFKEKYGEEYYSSLVPEFIKNDFNGGLQQHFLATQTSRGAYDLDQESLINYGFHAYVRPGASFAYLENYLGRQQFDTVMKEFYATWNGSHPTTRDLQLAFERKTGKSLSWMFEDLLQTDKKLDYCLDHFHAHDDIAEINIKNVGEVSAPVMLDMKNSELENKSLWLEGIREDTLIIINNQKLTEVQLDAIDESLDINRGNDYLSSEGLLRRAKIKWKPLISLDDKDQREIMYTPYLGFNEVDKLWLGAALYNSSVDFKSFKWLLAPAYSFGTGNVVGHTMFKYNQVRDDGIFEQIEYRLPLKSFSYFEGIKFDYDLQYWKIDPSIRFYFNRKKAHTSSYIEARYIHILEEIADVGIDGLENKNIEKSQVYQLGYHKKALHTLGTSWLNMVLEYQKYDSSIETGKNYLKLTGDIGKQFYYSPHSKVSVRVFGAYFITNSQRESASFNNLFSRASVALMHQGFNDYLYDEYFFDRVNQASGFDQVSRAGGGFRNALGSTVNIGMTNDYAVALNLEADLPFRFLPLKLFADFGYYSTKAFTSEELSGEFLYSAGLSYGNELFNINIPLVYSDEIKIQYDVQDIGFLGRINFSFNLHQLTLWDRVDHLNF